MKIIKPGQYERVPMADYHGDLCAGPSVSSSGLRTIFTQSPAHYFVTSYLNPDREEEEDKEAFVLGRAAHHLLLGEDDFSTSFIMRPERFDSWRTKEAKEWKAQEEANGRTVLLPSQFDQIRGMARSLAKHDLIEAGILNGQIEQTLAWRDKETGIWLKARPDAIPSDSGDGADLKTTRHFGFDLDNSAAKLRYDMQGALVKIGFKEVLGLTLQSFSLIFVETKKPHCVDVLTLHGEDLEQAEKDLRVALRTFAHCLETGDWFGPSGSQHDARFLAFPQRIREQAEFRRDFLTREIAKAQIQPSQSDYAATP